MLKIVDTNIELVRACRKAGYTAEHSDYFIEAYNTQRAVLCTASNARFTFGGGIDALFWDKFYGPCSFKQARGGGMERLGNICFLITVDENLKATKEQIMKAMTFAKESTGVDEVLLLSGIGTGIGGLSRQEFVECLDGVFK